MIANLTGQLITGSIINAFVYITILSGWMDFELPALAGRLARQFISHWSSIRM